MKYPLALTIVLNATILAAQAAEPLWAPLPSPSGGAVRAIVEGSGGVLFAGSGNGVFKSADGGKTWVSVAGKGLADKGVFCLSYSAGRKLLLAGTHTGAFYSIDDGATWSPAKGLPNQFGDDLPVFCIAAAPDGTFYAGTCGGVFKSSDGASWKQAGKGLGSQAVWAVAAAGKSVYAGTTSGGNGGGPGGDVFFSNDNGETWTASNPSSGSYKGLRDQVFSVRALLVDASNPRIVYAGSLRSQYPKLVPAGLYRSADGGASWEHLLSGESCFALCQSGGTIFAAGEKLYAATDGTKFDEVATPAAWPFGALCKTKDAILLAANGVFRSPDGLSGWTPGGQGISALQQVNTVAVTANGDIYVKSQQDGLLRSKDAGKSWQPVQAGLKSKAGKLWLNGYGEVMMTVGPQIAWLDKDDTWHMVELGVKDPAIQGVLVTAGKTIYVGDMMGNIYRSNDQGNHGRSFEKFSKVVSADGKGAGIIFGFCEDPRGGGKVLYVGAEKNGVFKSEDAGATWTCLGNPATGNGYCVMLTPTGDLVFGKGSNNGVWVYRMADKQWVQAKGIRQGDSVYSFHWCGATNQILCAGDRGLYVCGDGKAAPDGLTWTDCSDGLPHFNRAYNGAVRPVADCFDKDGIMYVGISGEGHGIYRSTRPLGAATNPAGR